MTESVLSSAAAQGNTAAAASEQLKPPQQPAAAPPPEPKPAETKLPLPKVGEPPKAEQTKPTESEAPKAKAPEKYELKVPDGFSLDQELMGKLEPVLRGADLDNAQAQALLDLSVEQQKKTIDAVQAQRVEVAKGWEKEFRNDPAFGGANFDQSLALVREAINRYEPGLLKELGESEWGSNPRLLRLLAKVGKATKEDSAGNVQSQSRERVDPLRALYPTMAK